jgi:hypothetical protein
VEGRKLPADILAKAVQCHCLLYLWQLQQFLHDEAAPPTAWCGAISLFREQLHCLLKTEDPKLKAVLIRALTDFYIIFRSPEFEVRCRTPNGSQRLLRAGRSHLWHLQKVKTESDMWHGESKIALGVM